MNKGLIKNNAIAFFIGLSVLVFVFFVSCSLKDSQSSSSLSANSFIEAGALRVEPKDLAANLQPLSELIKKFPGYEKCLSHVIANLPPDLNSDMLPSFNLPDALCRTREALANKEISACRRMVSYSLQRGCELMYAIYYGEPDSCPRGYPPSQGRDGYCLAMARRDVSACRGAKNEDEEVRCLAILQHDSSYCTNLSQIEKREACRVEVGRWIAAIGGEKPLATVGSRPTFELEFKSKNPERPAPFEKVMLACADQGVIAPTAGPTEMMIFCDYYPYGSRPQSLSSQDSPSQRTKVRFEFRPPKKENATLNFGTDARLALSVRGWDEFIGQQRGTVTFDAFELRRGGRVKGRLHLILSQGQEELIIDGEFDSFIRDLVSPAEIRSGSFGYRQVLPSAPGRIKDKNIDPSEEAEINSID